MSLATSPALAPRAAYDLAAADYDGWDWQAFWRRAEFPLVARLVAEGRQAAARLLDVGCGTGWPLAHLGRDGALAVGVDISLGMLRQARRRLPAAQLALADARQLPLASGGFDIVLCARVLSHLPDPDRAIGELVRVAAPGARVILTDVDADHPYEHTRLPVGAGHVVAETHKHPRAALAAILAGEGLAHESSWLLFADLQAAPIETLGETAGRRPVGWISAWTRRP